VPTLAAQLYFSLLMFFLIMIYVLDVIGNLLRWYINGMIALCF